MKGRREVPLCLCGHAVQRTLICSSSLVMYFPVWIEGSYSGQRHPLATGECRGVGSTIQLAGLARGHNHIVSIDPKAADLPAESTVPSSDMHRTLEEITSEVGGEPPPEV